MTLAVRLALQGVLFLHVLAAPVFRQSQHLRREAPGNHQPAQDALSLKRLALNLTLANSHGADKDGFQGSLPVYVPSSDVKKPLILKRINYNFSSKDATELNYSKAHGLTGHKNTGSCTPTNTVFDVGFYDGIDSKAYLTGGYCVVGVEADPDLVAAALQKYSVWVATGQLRLANVAIAPNGDTQAWTVFYRNKCTKEWNSFIKNVGCRACQPPHHVDENACEATIVDSMDCAGIFGTFGVPHYLKLDIEGAEMGCFQAMQKFPPGTQLPLYVSAEITTLDYIDAMAQLGYKGFKVVRQDGLIQHTEGGGASSSSGPWGENALDCRSGVVWRDYHQARAEFALIMGKPFDANDPCPGGILPIHTQPETASFYVWYDVHATLNAPAVAR